MQNTFKLVLLILLALAVLGLYALLQKPLSIGDWSLKQISLRNIVSDVTKTDTSNSAEKDSVKTVAKAQHILLFGDSMTGLLCYPMSRYAEENGHTLDCMVWTSSNPSTWVKSGKLATLLATTKPTYVIISLGSNELTSKDLDGMEKNIRALLKVIGNIPVVWIGPPNWCEDGGINDLLLKIMGKGSFFSSKDLTLERRGDGRHPTQPAANKWMDAIAKWMGSPKAANPILMNAPKGTKGDLGLTVLDPKGNVVMVEQRTEIKKSNTKQTNSK